MVDKINFLVQKQLIYGCMGLGGNWTKDPIGTDDIKLAEKAIEKALEIGIRIFDHADIYTIGKAESVFGKILHKNSSLRQKIILQSKSGICLHSSANNSNYYNLSKAYLLKQVDAILKRLQTDYLDRFLLHRPDPLMDPEEIAATFKILQQSGKVREFGVSNMSVFQIKSIQHYWDEPLIANQIQLSLGHSLIVDSGVLVNTINSMNFNGVEGLLEYARSHQMIIQAYSALDGGRFTGNIEMAKSDDKKTIQLLQQMAEKYNTSNLAIALAWLFKLPAAIQPIIGTTNVGRIGACKDATEINLSREDWYNLWITARGEKIP
jgi:predicted oxidoreductase